MERKEKEVEREESEGSIKKYRCKNKKVSRSYVLEAKIYVDRFAFQALENILLCRSMGKKN